MAHTSSRSLCTAVNCLQRPACFYIIVTTFLITLTTTTRGNLVTVRNSTTEVSESIRDKSPTTSELSETKEYNSSFNYSNKVRSDSERLERISESDVKVYSVRQRGRNISMETTATDMNSANSEGNKKEGSMLEVNESLENRIKRSNKNQTTPTPLPDPVQSAVISPTPVLTAARSGLGGEEYESPQEIQDDKNEDMLQLLRARGLSYTVLPDDMMSKYPDIVRLVDADEMDVPEGRGPEGQGAEGQGHEVQGTEAPEVEEEEGKEEVENEADEVELPESPDSGNETDSDSSHSERNGHAREDELQPSMTELSSETEKMQHGTTKLLDGKTKLLNGTTKLLDGPKLPDEKTKLLDGRRKLRDRKTKMDDKSSKPADTTSKPRDGSLDYGYDYYPYYSQGEPAHSEKNNLSSPNTVNPNLDLSSGAAQHNTTNTGRNSFPGSLRIHQQANNSTLRSRQTVQPGLQPNTQPGSQPNTQPGSQQNTQPGSQPNTQPGSQPNTQPGSQPNTQPGSKPNTQPGSQPNTQPGFQPLQQLTTNHTGRAQSRNISTGPTRRKTVDSRLPASTIFGIVAGCVFGSWMILCPLLCFLCKCRDSVAKKKKRFSERLYHQDSNNGIMEAMIMTELGKEPAKFPNTIELQRESTYSEKSDAYHDVFETPPLLL